jgi:hypothetical protein
MAQEVGPPGGKAETSVAQGAAQAIGSACASSIMARSALRSTTEAEDTSAVLTFATSPRPWGYQQTGRAAVRRGPPKDATKPGLRRDVPMS